MRDARRARSLAKHERRKSVAEALLCVIGGQALPEATSLGSSKQKLFRPGGDVR
jgi:hypothetical protein